MNLKNVASVNDCKSDLYDTAIDIVSDAFIEEPWFEYVLSSIDVLYSDDKETARWRKRCLMRAMIEDDVARHGNSGLYLLEDETAALGAYRYSELPSNSERRAVKTSSFIETATPEELKAIDDRKHDIDRITINDWGPLYEKRHGRADADCIHIYAVAVSKQARGSGALRRMFKSLFRYADENALNTYLECYASRLCDIYKHFGFEIVEELSSDSCAMRCWMMKRQWEHPTIRQP